MDGTSMAYDEQVVLTIPMTSGNYIDLSTSKRFVQVRLNGNFIVVNGNASKSNYIIGEIGGTITVL